MFHLSSITIHTIYEMHFLSL